MNRSTAATSRVTCFLCASLATAVAACPPLMGHAPQAAGNKAANAGFAEIRSAEDLLKAVEKSDAGLKTLSAAVMYDRVFEIQGDRQTRLGKVFFENREASADGEKPRRAGAQFTSLRVGDRVIRETYEIVFDGEFFVERWPEKKVLVKTRLGRKGDDDPLRVGRGPIPLPFGQRASDILTRYDATLVPAEDGASGHDESQTTALRAFVEGSVQLKLTVKKDLAAGEDLHEIRLWYRRDEEGRLIPRLARAVNRAGDVSLVQLIDVKLNEPLPEGVLETGTPGPGWDVQIRDMDAR